MCKLVLLLLLLLPTTQGAVPGTFFWKPRLGLHLSYPTRAPIMANQPTRWNIQQGMVILIDGYQVGLTVIALVAGYFAATKPYLHLSPMHAHFYTNAYRWGLRHLNLIPYWLGGLGENYVDTHKVWRRRYYYMDEFTPKWLRKLVPWVDKDEWTQEEMEFKRYIQYGEPAFGKHYRYPTKTFRNFASQFTKETIENRDSKDWLERTGFT